MVDRPGKHNNVDYEKTVSGGEPKHIALVPNPRYEGAKIFLNSVTEGSMKLKAWIKKALGADGKPLTNAVDTEGSGVEVDGKKVLLKDLISAYEDDEKKKKKKLI